MTRLTDQDVRAFPERVRELERRLQAACGLDLRGLAAHAAALPSSWANERLAGARFAAVPMTSGLGVISGFSTAVAAVLRHLGGDAQVTAATDVSGIEEAVQAGAEVVFVADDDRFIALNVREGQCVDNDSATAEGYVAALAAAAHGLEGRRVLLLGLGPVGRHAARRLLAHGATVLAVEPRAERLRAALIQLPGLRTTTLAQGLRECRLIYDATPVSDLVDVGAITPETIAAVPGLPSGFTAAAQAALGPRHIHDPLAIGVAVMAARALAARPAERAAG